MKARIAALMACALGAGSCAVLGGGGRLSPDPVVWTDEVQYDFGTIPATETVSHVFAVRNRGGKPLNLERVQTSCGCTAAVLDKQFLKPGETTRLKVTFDPRGRHGSTSRSITIYSNDPKNRQKQLTITANVAAGPAQPEVTSGAAPSSTLMQAIPAPVSATSAAPSAPAPVQAAPAGSATLAQPAR